MKNLTIRRRIMASFAVVLALMVIMAAFAYIQLMKIDREATFIAGDAVSGLTFTNQIVLDRIANYSLTQEFVLQTSQVSKQTLQTAILATRAYLDTLISEYEATINTPAEKALFDSYKSAENLYKAAQDAVLKAGLDPTKPSSITTKPSSSTRAI